MSQFGTRPPPPPPPAPDNPLQQAPAGRGKPKPSGLRNAVEWVAIIAGALLVAFLVKTFLVQAFYIPSGSMLPTLRDKDRVLVNKLSYDLHEIHRGDIVVFEGPEQAEGQVKDLIKRVIGLPGETVEAHDGQVFVNGQPLSEPYLGDGITTGPLEPQHIPANHYWVMGDNRGNSKDSRFFGAIDRSLIIGRAFVRVWPVTRLHFF
jgi:signal peptidase I